MPQDQLFATLDPTMRGLDHAVRAPGDSCRIRSGSSASLPTELVAAFRATLEEVSEADVILHVRDIAHPDSMPRSGRTWSEVLDGMVKDGTLDEAWPMRMIEVLNKADLRRRP